MRKTSKGYILLAGHNGHPNANNRGEILEHTYVMSQMLGRGLKTGENVHHKNGVRTDNSTDNLELWLVKQPPGQRVEDLVVWAEEILRTYKPNVLAD